MKRKSKLLVLICFATLLTFFVRYMAYSWIETTPVIWKLKQITSEPPNSRELLIDPFWILVPESDENGNITRYVTNITRDFTWVWGNTGIVRVHIYFDDQFSDGSPHSYQADWILYIEKKNGKWEIVDYDNIP